MSSTSNTKFSSPNSFYNIGDISILTFAQDELSNLWKFYLSTPEHYVVSREFDKSHGLYANAPDEIIRHGLMDFSASIEGKQLSIFAIMDMFIDRCFSDSVFDEYTSNGIWMCIDIPTYNEVEDMLSSYGCRIMWNGRGEDKQTLLDEMMERLLFKTPNVGNGRDDFLKELVSELKRNKITTIFLNDDKLMNDIVLDKAFDDYPIFKGVFSSGDDGEFASFKYIGH